MPRLSLLCLAAVAFVGLLLAANDEIKVGVQPDGRIVVPTNQVLEPAGKQITFPGRPVDLAFADDGKTVVVKNMRDLVFLDAETGKIKQTLSPPKPTTGNAPGFGVVGLVVQDDRIYAGDTQNQVRVAERDKDGNWKWAAKHIEVIKPLVGGQPYPAGITFSSKEEMWVAASRGNAVQVVNMNTGQAEQIVNVGVAPFAVLFKTAEKGYVTNWGGDPPKDGDTKGTTSGTPVRIDPRTGVANHGTVSVIAPAPGKWKQTKTIEVGLHPSAMVLSKQGIYLYVANAASDTISVIDTKTDTVIDTIEVRPEGRLPFGSGPNALALSPDGGTLYVANGTNNCIAVVVLGAKVADGIADSRPKNSFVAGLIPTGWFPGAVLVSPDNKRLYVANIKGHGSLSQPRAVEKGKNSHDHLGSVSIIDVPDRDQLKKYTERVNTNNRLTYSLSGLEKPRNEVKPAVVPERHGEPSVIKHVIYVIKENRTYDQVLGDMKEGNGEPKLVMFGEEVTPNHHKLAREFTLFDNFYCSGVLSADGHTWTDQAIVTDYLERSFGGFTRSYPYEGSDPLAFAPTGFIWDNALAHKKTIRNYGEHTETKYEPEKAKWIDCYNDYKNGTSKVKVKATPNHDSLKPFTHASYPWFPLMMPDVVRAKLFIDELKEFEKKGEFPNLTLVTLPCNHTSGTRPDFPTPRAMVADNDLALGQIVEAVSKSKFWPETAIFVVEDDPQNGFDHVDGHRTVALVISPYTKRKFVDHTNYNQTGMVKTIELMLGLPPMNQLDLSATPMRNCFQEKSDLTAYKCEENRIKLDEMNKPMASLKGEELKWAKKSMELDLDEGDAADEDTLNRILWHATRGYDVPYPEEYAGKRGE